MSYVSESMQTASDEGEAEDDNDDLSHLGAATALKFQTVKEDSGTSTFTTFKDCSNITHMDSVTAGRDVNILNPRKVLLQCPVPCQSGGETKKKRTWTEKLRQRSLLIIQEWTNGMVKTSALAKVMEKLNKGIDWITIRGSPGEGKSTVGLMALGELHKKGRDVFLLTSPSEFSQVISTCPGSVIMLDDVFGDLEFDRVKWHTWKDALNEVLSLKEHRSHEQQSKKSVTVILAGRDYVLNTGFSDMGRLADFFTQDEHIVNMQLTANRTNQEKIAIWKAISDSSGIELDGSIVDKICCIKVSHGFPHVCRLFVTSRKKNPEITAEDFFQSPLEFLNQTVLKFMQNHPKLVLFKELIKNDGKISFHELEKLNSGSEAILTAYDLVGTYLRKEDDCVVFAHPSIYDSVAFNICKLWPLFVIDNCSLSFINERVRIQPSRDMQHESSGRESGLVVYIPISYVGDLAKRFAAEVSKLNLLQVFSHKEFRDELFLKEVMSILQPLSELITLTDSASGENFLSLLASNQSPQLLKYVHNHIGRQLRKDEVNAVLYGVCSYAASGVLTYLIQICDTLDINVKCGVMKQTPLMMAAETRDSQFVQNILSLNPDVNARDEFDKTAFHYLCWNGLESAVTQMFDRVTDINLKDRLGWSPLLCACQSSNMEVVKLLLERGAEIDSGAVRDACLNGSVEIVSLLFERGATVNTTSGYGDTPLHSACVTGNMEVIRYLIDKGASVNIQVGESHESPLHTACNWDKSKAVKYLLDHGANMKIRDNKGNTPLHTAAESCSIECVDMLLKAGADVNVQTEDGYTPLHKAAEIGSKECVNVLLEAGANVNVQTKDGQIPLHVAVYYKPVNDVYLPNLYVCQTLIRNRSDINKQDAEGNTPLHLLCRVGSRTAIHKDWPPQPASSYEKVYRTLVTLLINYGACADFNIRNNRGEPTLHGWCQKLVGGKHVRSKKKKSCTLC